MRIFISHSERDAGFARKLTNDLERYGYTVWLGEREVRVGQSRLRSVQDGINRAEFFLPIISESGIQSALLRLELDAALQAEIRGDLQKVLPVLREHVPLPSLMDGRECADFTGRRYKMPLRSLLAGLGHDLESISVMASFISKSRRLENLIPHLIDHFKLSVVPTWRPMDVHVELTAGYLSYLRDSSIRVSGLNCHSPYSPLILNPDSQPLETHNLQIGFGHFRAHLMCGADIHHLGNATLSLPNWKHTIHIAGPSGKVKDAIDHLTSCEYLGDEVREDIADIGLWWKSPRLIHRHSVRVSGIYFHRDIVTKSY